MPVTIHVNGTSNSLVHKGSNGIAKNTPPDVCKTPSPGGPVPIPYPVIISMSSDLDNGTTTVKVDGGNMAAIKGSEFTRCSGDEPGTAGGVVSNTNMKEAKWILYSFDVKLDGQNACRLTDKMTMNHGNTACLAGVLQMPVETATEILQKICCECDEEVQPGPYDTCAKVGEKKHACCEQKLMNQKGLGGERGYNRDGSEFTNGPRAQLPGEDYWDMRARIRGVRFPDACLLDTSGNPAKFYDFKFGCPEGVPVTMSRNGVPGPLSTGLSRPTLEGNQLRKYQDLSEKLGCSEEPEPISNRDC